MNGKQRALVVGAGVACGLVWTWGNEALTVSEYTVVSPRLPQAFDGLRVVQISDLHGHRFGREQWRLVGKLRKCHPDLIVVTGDLIDRRRYDLAAAMELAEELPTLAPTYYVPGNHEAWSGRYEEVRRSLARTGITMLEDESRTFSKNGQSIRIIGARDPGFLSPQHTPTELTGMEECLAREVDPEAWNLLLSHRPELFSLYVRRGVDLTFSGHAHGGQVRLPGVGGLYAPHQGILPAYDGGNYQEGSSTMIVSRGLGNSLFPMRVGNRPEIVTVTLRRGPAKG